MLFLVYIAIRNCNLFKECNCKNQPIEEVRKIRDEINKKVKHLIKEVET